MNKEICENFEDFAPIEFVCENTIQKEVREQRKEYSKEYFSRPEVKERMREYRREYYEKNKL